MVNAGVPQSRTAGTERKELLESRKQLEKFRADAEELRRTVKRLEEQTSKESVQANSEKTSAKSSEKSVTRIVYNSTPIIPYLLITRFSADKTFLQ
jgi:hypothetical protein